MPANTLTADELVRVWASMELKKKGEDVDWKTITYVNAESWKDGYCETCEYDVDGIVVTANGRRYEISWWDFGDAVAEIIALSKMSEYEIFGGVE